MKSFRFFLPFFMIVFCFFACADMSFAQESTSRRVPKSNKAPENIPTAYIDEALAFAQECEATPEYRDYYNCECMGVKYLDERIDQGNSANKDLILLAIQKECRDGTYQAGIMYNRCMYEEMRPPAGQSQSTFCECVAGTFGNLYESVYAAPSSDVYIAMRTRSVIACRDPALARELYDYVPVPRKK